MLILVKDHVYANYFDIYWSSSWLKSNYNQTWYSVSGWDLVQVFFRVIFMQITMIMGKIVFWNFNRLFLKICIFHWISPSCSAFQQRNIIFDNNPCMEDQIWQICQSVYFHIRNVNGIRKKLSHETAATLIHALITSRIDNSNSLLTGAADHSLHKLQLAQNAATRILIKTHKFDHITPI